MKQKKANKLKRKISYILRGITHTTRESDQGYWDHVHGATYGGKRLAEIMRAIDKLVKK